MGKRDLIYFSPIPWHGLHQRPQHMANILSERYRVLFVEPRTLSVPGPPAGTDMLRHLALPVFPFNARNGLIRNAAWLAGHLPPLRALLLKKQARALLEAASDMDRPLLYFGHPDMARLRRFFQDSPVAYDHMDDVLLFGNPPAGLRRDLRALVREASLLSASSAALADALRAMGGSNVVIAGNGVEWDHFIPTGDRIAEPAGLATLARPRVVYVGAVAEWFDFELLYAVATRLPAFSFPVLGPVRPSVSAVAGQAPPNVHFLGTVPYSELPAWLHNCNSAIIPFQINELTSAVDPVKLYEYLAAGLPVTATPFSPELRMKGGAVGLASQVESFAESVRHQVETPPETEKLRGQAAARAWPLAMAPVLEQIESLIQS